MKDKINRLAKGIIEDDQPVILVRPERFQEILEPGTETGFALEIESLSGKNMRGFCFCDDPRVCFESVSFMGRIVHQSFAVSTGSLPDGAELKGLITLVTNAGEFRIPYCFLIKEKEQAVFGKTAPLPDPERYGCVTETTESFDEIPEQPLFAAGGSRELLFEEEAGADGGMTSSERILLAEMFPEDEELVLDVCTMLIRENAAGDLAFVFYEHAVSRGIQITHLYESYLAAWPENRQQPMPREVLLYYSYETELTPLDADKLYRNVIAHEPENSELYRQYEPRMRDFTAKSLQDGRMNRNLKYIYDRMLYPDMIDAKMAAVLPDLLKTHRVRIRDPRAVTVHVRYPQLKGLVSGRLKNGQAYVPVYFKDALITFHDADGSELPSVGVEDEKLMERPDLLRRCFAVDPEHPMLVFSAVREILGRGIRSEEEKEILITALTELEFEDRFRRELIRALSRAGGDTSWIDRVDWNDLDQETGNFAFRALMQNGRWKDAYLYLRGAGLEGRDMTDLSGLASELLTGLQKPVLQGTDTDRFFLCMCKAVFDAGQATVQIMDFLTTEYEGDSEEMFGILREADRNGLPVHDLPERTLSVMLFAEAREHIDETFAVYLKKDAQKEHLLRAFFTLRMTDYFEHEDLRVSEEVFEALTSYLGLIRYPEGLPEIFFIGLTKYYSGRETLTAKELELCQKFTDLLISRDLVFRHMKELRKKVKIPASICERYFVEYIGTKTSAPRMVARISPDEQEYAPVNLKRVFRNVFVSSVVLFLGEEMRYMIYDDALGPDPVQQGVIHVKKMHGKEENRFLLLNRMTKALADGDTENLRRDMTAYAVGTEVNRELFRL